MNDAAIKSLFRLVDALQTLDVQYETAVASLPVVAEPSEDAPDSEWEEYFVNDELQCTAHGIRDLQSRIKETKLELLQVAAQAAPEAAADFRAASGSVVRTDRAVESIRKIVSDHRASISVA